MKCERGHRGGADEWKYHLDASPEQVGESHAR
jgi:hypothetical protein